MKKKTKKSIISFNCKKCGTKQEIDITDKSDITCTECLHIFEIIRHSDIYVTINGYDYLIR